MSTHSSSWITRVVPLRELAYWACGLLLLAATYFGAYYALVDRSMTLVTPEGKGPAANPVVIVVPRYAYGGERIASFFSLAWTLDQKMRPDHWSLRSFTSR